MPAANMPAVHRPHCAESRTARHTGNAMRNIAPAARSAMRNPVTADTVAVIPTPVASCTTAARPRRATMTLIGRRRRVTASSASSIRVEAPVTSVPPPRYGARGMRRRGSARARPHDRRPERRRSHSTARRRDAFASAFRAASSSPFARSCRRSCNCRCDITRKMSTPRPYVAGPGPRTVRTCRTHATFD